MSKKSLKTIAKVPSLWLLAMYTLYNKLFLYLDILTSSALCPVLKTPLGPIINHTTSTKSSSELPPIPPQQLRILSLYLNAPSTFLSVLRFTALCLEAFMCLPTEKVLLHMLWDQNLRKTH